MGRLVRDNPVCLHEWRLAARGRGAYFGRAAAVAVVLGLLILMRASTPGDLWVEVLPSAAGFVSRAAMAAALAAAVFVAPSLTGGAIADDRRRGRLADFLVTDLSALEIIVGKLAGGLAGLALIVPALGPVLIAAGTLGGVDPSAVVAGLVAAAAVAALAGSLAIVFSIRARHGFEATATAWAAMVALGSLADAWAYYIGPPPYPVRATDLRTIVTDPTRSGFSAEWLGLVAGCLAGTAGLVAVASWRLRPDGLREGVRKATGGRGRRVVVARSRPVVSRAWGWFDRIVGRRLGMPEPTLDAAPVFWRGLRRADSAWMRRASLGYAVVGIGAVAWEIDHWHAGIVNGYLVEAGMILVGIAAATAWDEDRARGGLSPILTTPLDGPTIVRETWWGVYRIVPRLALIPTVVVLIRGVFRGSPIAAGPMAVAAGALVLAYGSVATGVGLWVGLRVPRAGRAVAWTVGVLLLAGETWPWFWMDVLGIPIGGANSIADPLLAWVSPRCAAYLATAWPFFLGREPEIWPYAMSVPVWALGLAAIGLAIRRRLERGFDRRVGRMPDEPGPAHLNPPDPAGAGGRGRARRRSPQPLA